MTPRLLATVLCEYAGRPRPHDRNYVMGTFSALQAEVFPHVPEALAVFVQLDGRGRCVLSLDAVNPAGTPLFAPMTELVRFSWQREPAEVVFRVQITFLNVVNLTLDGPGTYTFCLAVDGEPVGERFLYVAGPDVLPRPSNPGALFN